MSCYLDRRRIDVCDVEHKLVVTLTEEDNVIIDEYQELNLLVVKLQSGEELCRYRLEKI